MSSDETLGELVGALATDPALGAPDAAILCVGCELGRAPRVTCLSFFEEGAPVYSESKARGPLGLLARLTKALAREGRVARSLLLKIDLRDPRFAEELSAEEGKWTVTVENWERMVPLLRPRTLRSKPGPSKDALVQRLGGLARDIVSDAHPRWEELVLTAELEPTVASCSGFAWERGAARHVAWSDDADRVLPSLLALQRAMAPGRRDQFRSCRLRVMRSTREVSIDFDYSAKSPWKVTPANHRTAIPALRLGASGDAVTRKAKPGVKAKPAAKAKLGARVKLAGTPTSPGRLTRPRAR